MMLALLPTRESIRRQPSSVATSVSPVTQGFEALIGLVFADVCQRLMLSWYWMPGSPQTQAASAILLRRYRAFVVSTEAPVVMALVVQSPSFSTASMKSSVTRTELFEFWKKTDA